MRKDQAPRQQNMKQKKEAMQRLSRFCQEGRMQAPKEEHSRNKEDSRRQIQKECITKKIIYSQVSKVLLWSLF
jgi:hypothetical protein